MSILYQKSENCLHLGVTDLVRSDSEMTGPSDGISHWTRLALGRTAHEIHQEKLSDPSTGEFQKEVFVRAKFEVDDTSVVLQGRIDCLHTRVEEVSVEEIKTVILSTAQFTQIEASQFPDYQYQLQVYCWIYSLQNPGARIVGNLLFINLLDHSRKKIEVPWTQENVREFSEQRVRQILRNLHEEELFWTHRRSWVDNIHFPFESLRPHQDRLVKSVASTLNCKRNLMINAPAGIGKTAGVLFPALRHAFASDLRIFFATAKTTQQDIVWKTLQLMHHEDAPFMAVRLKAKEKMCANEVYQCHEDHCRFLQNLSAKIKDNQIHEKTQAHRLLPPEYFLDLGRNHLICPFELSLRSASHADVIVGDYNYVFDPSVALNSLFDSPSSRGMILIIDEAHNLYQRALEYYSPVLDRRLILHLQFLPPLRNAELDHQFQSFLNSLDKAFSELEGFASGEEMSADQVVVELSADTFRYHRKACEDLLLRYHFHLKETVPSQAEDPYREFLYQFLRFHNVLSIGGEEFRILLRVRPHQELKILCLDPSNQLRKQLANFDSVIAMSATLRPSVFYQNVLGFDGEKTDFMHFCSPFSNFQRLVKVWPRISTTYRNRDRHIPHVADLIRKAMSIKPGNYAVFLPSFTYLKRLEDELGPHFPNLLVQTSSMKDEEREEFWKQVDSRTDLLILAVQGGIFSEGMDFSGDRLIGVFIISPALPTVNFERELMRQYYEEQYGQGFEYAYVFPGMTRVIQSVGRLIRTESDRGVAILVCSRFASSPYQDLFPEEWHSPETPLVSEDEDELLDSIRRFWGNEKET